MGDFSPGDLPRLRRGAYQFVRRYAALAWQFQHDGNRWEITLPPDVAARPEQRRYTAHARQEARRLAGAQLYDLDSGITGLAACLGAAIWQGRHEEAVALAGHPGVAATLEIQPPAASGFVRWRDGIGSNGLGAPVVACHWGPAGGGGLWLAWWADSHAMAAGYAAEIRAAGQPVSAGAVTRIFGPLWYDHQELLRPSRGSARHGNSIPQPATAEAGPASAEAGTPGLTVLYITLATWWLLTCPDAAVQLTRQPAPDTEQTADRAAGLCPRPVTVATAAGIS
jgi:hypothetical protein